MWNYFEHLFTISVVGSESAELYMYYDERTLWKLKTIWQFKTVRLMAYVVYVMCAVYLDDHVLLSVSITSRPTSVTLNAATEVKDYYAPLSTWKLKL